MQTPLRITTAAMILVGSLIACGRHGGNQETARSAESGDSVQPARKTVVIPAETPLVVVLRDPLSTKENLPGDTFRTELSVAISVEREEVLPEGSMLLGRIAELGRGGDGKPTIMRLTLTETVLPTGRRQTIDAGALNLTAHSSTEKGLEKVAVGGVAGGLVGGIVGGKKGAAVGAVLGAGAGTAVAIATKDNTIRLETGQQLEFRLKQPVTLHTIAA